MSQYSFGSMAAVALVAFALPADAAATLTYIPNSTQKLYQVTGDCDWERWDATITQRHPKCVPTKSQTATRADVLGDDVPVVIDDGKQMFLTFGDTFGAVAPRHKWIGFKNTFKWDSHDPIAHSSSTSPATPLEVDYFMDGDHAMLVLPKTSAGKAIDMGADDVPSGGVVVDGQLYLSVTTGTTSSDGSHQRDTDYSVLVKADPTRNLFDAGRTLSSPPQGRFVRPAFAVGADSGSASPADNEVVWSFGVSQQAKGVYLSKIPTKDFWSGNDVTGKSATQYFMGLDKSGPSWSPSEADAQPMFTSPSAANPDIPYLTVSHWDELNLWILIFDAAGAGQGQGMYLTTASDPWGPWSSPQLIFNPCRDKGYGHFMFYYYATPADNDCPSAMPAGRALSKGGAGPAGPSAGDQQKNVPDATRGIDYGPAIVGRFTTVSGDTLKLYYMMSTWNPYAIVMMESDFRVACVTYSGKCGPPSILPNPTPKPGPGKPPTGVQKQK